MLADATLVAGVLGCTFLAERVRNGARPWGMLIFASLLPLVKVIGVMVWPAVLWSLWSRGRNWRISSVVMVLPIALWLVRNLVLFGELAESFPGQPRSLESIVSRTSHRLTNWFIPGLESIVVVLISGAVLIGVLFTVWRRLGRPALPGLQTPWLLSAASFLALFWIGSATRSVDLPDSRLLAPLFVLVLVLASRFGAALQERAGLKIMVLGIAWTALIGVQGVLATQHHLLAPQAAYFDLEDRFAAIVKTSVSDLGGSDLVWSNIPEFVFWHTGHWSQWLEPERLEARMASPGSPVRAIWFNFSGREGLVHPREMTGVDWQEPIIREGVELWRGVAR